MAKFSKFNKLSKKEEQELLIDFCRALVELKTPEEAAHFLKDLLSRQEAQMLAKRIAIARYLINGATYKEIQRSLKVSEGTVSRVNHWLMTSGEGYRLIVQRVKPEKSKQEKFIEELEKPFSWKQTKKRYTSYFWPELLLEEIIKSARKKQKERLKSVLDKFDEKSELFEQLNLLLTEKYKPHRKLISKNP